MRGTVHSHSRDRLRKTRSINDVTVVRLEVDAASLVRVTRFCRLGPLSRRVNNEQVTGQWSHPTDKIE